MARKRPTMFRPEAPSTEDPLWAAIEADFNEFAKYPRSMGSIYAIVAMCSERPIKIGFSEMPLVRLQHLQTANAFVLQLLGTIQGRKSTEEKIHRYLYSDRLMGEWFRPSAKTMGVVGRLTDPGKVVLLSGARHAA